MTQPLTPEEFAYVRARAFPDASVEKAAPSALTDCDIDPRPLAYPLTDYHRAGIDGPLHATWQDKPHRLLYDLIAAVRYYSAQQAAQPVAGEPVMVEAVAEVVDTDDGLTLRWLIEGGIAAMSDGAVLVMPHSPITGNDGSGEVYTAAPAAVGLSDDWLSRHALLAADCPPASVVVLLSSIKRVIKAGKDGAK